MADRFINPCNTDIHLKYQICQELDMNSKEFEVNDDNTICDESDIKENRKYAKFLASNLLHTEEKKCNCSDSSQNDENSSEYCEYCISKYNKKKRKRLFKYNTQHNIQSKGRPLDIFRKRIALKPMENPTRKISSIAYRVLDAPGLINDYYCNLLDWSKNDIVSIGLGASCYLWQGKTEKSKKLCDRKTNTISALNFNQSGSKLCIGYQDGLIEIWDPIKCQIERSYLNHARKVGTLSCKENILASGSMDSQVVIQDLRCSPITCDVLDYHSQEVVGLKWNNYGDFLASGGNDNKLLIWDSRNLEKPTLSLKGHKAAVKGITWSSQKDQVCLSGGGTADPTIRLWDINTGKLLQRIDTCAQIGSIIFSRNSNQFVTTHGFSTNESLQNKIFIWSLKQDYKQKAKKVATLSGHNTRVLYLALSPDGEKIITGAGGAMDHNNQFSCCETLRFWNVFPAKRKETSFSSSLFDSGAITIR
ncbi:unnamed protein product [Moneuplotes crassus]|uniref:CDC20/Fizzy WD40 domain-containing protein n=1 Tax=Euplotes crassus TaxID=5936 RepID=A0AAD1XCF0_EUPCR|nr:unnamed protein product [Moneuplotes crassus]